jgi:hypothetical protein
MANGAATPSGRDQRAGKMIGKINISIEKFDSALINLRITEPPPQKKNSVNNFFV